MFKCTSHHSFVSGGLSNTLIEHLSQQLELYKSQVSAKMDYIATLEDDLVVKEDVIKVFLPVESFHHNLDTILFTGSDRGHQ